MKYLDKDRGKNVSNCKIEKVNMLVFPKLTASQFGFLINCVVIK